MAVILQSVIQWLAFDIQNKLHITTLLFNGNLNYLNGVLMISVVKLHFVAWIDRLCVISNTLRRIKLTLHAPNATLVDLLKNPICTRSCFSFSASKYPKSFLVVPPDICVKLNETNMFNIFHFKCISNTWFQLKIHKNYFLSVLEA